MASLDLRADDEVSSPRRASNNLSESLTKEAVGAKACRGCADAPALLVVAAAGPSNGVDQRDCGAVR